MGFLFSVPVPILQQTKDEQEYDNNSVHGDPVELIAEIIVTI